MTADQTFEVAAEDAGERLDVVVAGRLDLSRSQAASRIDEGLVTVDGATPARSHRVRRGQQVSVRAPSTPDPVPPPPVPPIRYEDDDLLVVSKPAGLVVHPGAGTPSGTLVDALRAAGVTLATAADPGRPGIVHRLDKDTSGLLVVAKTDRAYRGLVSALKARTVRRRYLALAEGRLPAAHGRVDAPLGRDPADRKRFAVVADGKRAVTHWEVVDTGRSGTEVVSLLRCRLETGRTHQIRVHLSEAGHPVVGDVTYGARPGLATTLGLERFFLHAVELGFTHPVTGVEVEVTEPLPRDLAVAATAVGVDVDSGNVPDHRG